MKNKIYQTTDKETVNDLLRASKAELLTYDELITRSRNAYAEYLQKTNDIQKIKDIVEKI